MAAKFSTHYIPDEGMRFKPGDIVSLVHGAQQVQIANDPNGEYEVMGCRLATEYADSALRFRGFSRQILRWWALRRLQSL